MSRHINTVLIYSPCCEGIEGSGGGGVPNIFEKFSGGRVAIVFQEFSRGVVTTVFQENFSPPRSASDRKSGGDKSWGNSP